MRRREFIAGLGGAAAWPVVARAQQSDRVRRIGVLISWSENDPEFRSWLAAFIQELARLDWVDGRNVRIDQHSGNDDTERTGAFAKELVRLQPDVILAAGTPATTALQRETRTIPIVFSVIIDPVGSGFVASLPRPGGNITGFGLADKVIGGKWLQMLKEVAPSIKRAAAMYNLDYPSSYYLGPFEAAAQKLMVDPILAPVRSDAEIEAAIDLLGREQGGLVNLSDGFITSHRATIIAAADRNKVPTIAEPSFYTRDGGLLSYGPNFPDMFRKAAGYVNRILKGEKTADLPVELPTKYDLTINLKTAKAIGLTVPPNLLAVADEVIE
jgi:putative tryptophan/tyrosine transport system substrate-binding protein